LEAMPSFAAPGGLLVLSMAAIVGRGARRRSVVGSPMGAQLPLGLGA
jgi:hypothetical protein